MKKTEKAAVFSEFIFSLLVSAMGLITNQLIFSWVGLLIGLLQILSQVYTSIFNYYLDLFYKKKENSLSKKAQYFFGILTSLFGFLTAFCMFIATYASYKILPQNLPWHISPLFFMILGCFFGTVSFIRSISHTLYNLARLVKDSEKDETASKKFQTWIKNLSLGIFTHTSKLSLLAMATVSFLLFSSAFGVIGEILFFVVTITELYCEFNYLNYIELKAYDGNKPLNKEIKSWNPDKNKIIFVAKYAFSCAINIGYSAFIVVLMCFYWGKGLGWHISPFYFLGFGLLTQVFGITSAVIRKYEVMKLILSSYYGDDPSAHLTEKSSQLSPSGGDTYSIESRKEIPYRTGFGHSISDVVEPQSAAVKRATIALQ